MAEKKLLGPRKTPCASCPYRRDVPSGIWATEEYESLRKYDGSVSQQAASKAVQLFMCHQGDDSLCAGWTGCHDMRNNLAVRMHLRDLDLHAVCEYESPVPLFGSGNEAADHGETDIEYPSGEAMDAIEKIARVRGKRGQPVNFG